MKLKIKNQQDFWAGIMFIGFGVVAMYVSRDYPMGSAMRMGPGYFPTYLGLIMATLGAIISALSLVIEGEKVGRFPWRAMILLSMAFVFFGWAIDHVGFVLALLVLIVLASLAGKEFRLKEVIGLSIVLIVGAWALFIKGLELPYPLFWWR